ncbi:hypothetical protein [Nitrosopumilus sp.]|uniref:hypothetical protein n=1 Tax=Nitrosopumilus sp. TaxID=2024843 RepID=UPI00262BCCDE|nr:hypothetical protein [Nitrosopumilus sp.]
MPHVTLDSRIDLRELSKNFAPIFQKSPLIKISDIYVDKKGFSALLPTVVIDDKHQEFFIQISTTEEKTTIRLCVQTETIKTDAVKLSLVLLYKQVIEIFPSLNILHSNLFDFIEMEVNS